MSDKCYSHVHYVKSHVSARSGFTVDIANFYPSISHKMVFNFFKYEMHCGNCVAKKLAELTTQKYTDESGKTVDCLAQGTCFSHILSWLVCKRHFAKLHQSVSVAAFYSPTGLMTWPFLARVAFV